MTTTYRRHRLSEAEREQRRSAERERVKEAAEQLLTSEGWQRWVRARSMFRRYCVVIWRASVLARKESADLRRRHVIKRLRPDLHSAQREAVASGEEMLVGAKRKGGLPERGRSPVLAASSRGPAVADGRAALLGRVSRSVVASRDPSPCRVWRSGSPGLRGGSSRSIACVHIVGSRATVGLTRRPSASPRVPRDRSVRGGQLTPSAEPFAAPRIADRSPRRGAREFNLRQDGRGL